jgi:hypothetical protein
MRLKTLLAAAFFCYLFIAVPYLRDKYGTALDTLFIKYRTYFIKRVSGSKGFKSKTITRTPRGMMARSVLLILNHFLFSATDLEESVSESTSALLILIV